MGIHSAVPFGAWVGLSGILFGLGVIGFLVRRDPIVMFMCIELMLNAGNLLLVAAARYRALVDGQIYVFFVMTIAAAEVAVGLGIIVAVFRQFHDIDVDQMSEMRG